MLRKPIRVDAIKLDDAITRLLDDMDKVDTGSEEYATLVSELERLIALRTKNSPERVSRDTLATVAANLFGILIIVAYEQKHVMASKGLGFVLKPKS